MYKQVLILRKKYDNGHIISQGKGFAMVSHASLAFLTNMIKDNTKRIVENCYPAYEFNRYTREKCPMLYRREDLSQWAKEAFERGDNYFYAKPVNPNAPHGKLELCDGDYHYSTSFNIDKDLYEQWINGTFTKVVLEAKNKNQLLKAKTMAEEMGMKEGIDFFLIKDNCNTELEPEEFDENGVGRTLTAIGFRPMKSEIIDKIGKKFQLYK